MGDRDRSVGGGYSPMVLIDVGSGVLVVLVVVVVLWCCFFVFLA